MDEKHWAELFQQAFWIKRFDLRNQAEMLQALLGGKQEPKEELKEEQKQPH